MCALLSQEEPFVHGGTLYLQIWLCFHASLGCPSLVADEPWFRRVPRSLDIALQNFSRILIVGIKDLVLAAVSAKREAQNASYMRLDSQNDGSSTFKFGSTVSAKLRLNLTNMVSSSLSKDQHGAEGRKRGEMTTADKVIKTKVGLLELGRRYKGERQHE